MGPTPPPLPPPLPPPPQDIQVLVHVWIDLVQKYKHIVEQEGKEGKKNNNRCNVDDDDDDDDKQQQAVLLLLKAMNDLIPQLRQRLRRQQDQILHQKQQQQQRHPIGLVKILLLPARAFVKVAESQGILWQAGINSNNNNNNRFLSVRQSLLAKTVNETVLYFQQLLSDTLTAPSQCLDYDDDSNVDVDALWISSLVSVVMVLPSGQEIQALRMEEMKNQKLDVSRLECWRTISLAVKALLIMRSFNKCNDSNKKQQLLSKTHQSLVTSTLDGALFLRVVDSLTATIGVLKAFDDNRECHNSYSDHNMAKLFSGANTNSLETILVETSLDTLETWLQALMGTSRSRMAWIQVFPGTFAALYQRLLWLRQDATTAATSRVIATLSVLFWILYCTIAPNNSIHDNDDENDYDDATKCLSLERQTIVEQLEKLALLTHVDVGGGGGGGGQDQVEIKQTFANTTTIKAKKKMDAANVALESKFLGHVRQTLPLPLTQALKRVVIPMASQLKDHGSQTGGHSTRLMLDFCKLLLTAPCWHEEDANGFFSNNNANKNTTKNNTGKNRGSSGGGSNEQQGNIQIMQAAALDSIVLLCQGEKGNEEMFSMTSRANKVLLRQLQVERFSNLLQEVSVSCWKHDVSGILSNLGLLSGYATLAQGQRRLQRELCNWLLLMEPAKDEMQLFLSPFFGAMQLLFRVDFVHWPNFGQSLEGRFRHSMNLVSAGQRPAGPPFQFLIVPKSEIGANDWIQALTRHILRLKGTCQLIDQITAHIYQTLCQPKFGATTVEWLHNGISCLILMRQLILSMQLWFSKPKVSKSLTALAKVVLPLWTCSTCLELSNHAAFDGTSNQGFAHTALHKGTCCWTFHLLDLIATLVMAAGNRDLLLPSLYPLVEAAADGRCRFIPEQAAFMLSQVAAAYAYPSVSNLICSHLPSLSNLLLVRLQPINHRTTGRRAGARDSTELNAVIGVVCVLLEQYQAVHLHGNAPKDSFEALDHLKTAIVKLLIHFDHGVRTFPESLLLKFLDLFCITMVVWKPQLMPVDAVEQSLATADEPSWIRALDRFKKSIPLPCQAEKPAPHPQHSRQISKDDTDLASSLLHRAGHLLSSDSLSVQVASCQVLEAGFDYLGFVAKYPVTNDGEEPNGAATAILRHSAEIWPVVSTLVRSTWSLISGSGHSVALPFGQELLLITPSHNNSIMIQSRGCSEDKSLSVIFLKRLLDQIGVLVVHAEDFMALRFRDHIWPVVLDILNWTGHCSAFEERLVEAAVCCILRIYRCPKAGKSLTNLIPVAASALVKRMQSSSSQQQDFIIQTLEAMARLDFDTVYEPLHEQLDAKDGSLSQCHQMLYSLLLDSPEQELW